MGDDEVTQELLEALQRADAQSRTRNAQKIAAADTPIDDDTRQADAIRIAENEVIRRYLEVAPNIKDLPTTLGEMVNGMMQVQRDK